MSSEDYKNKVDHVSKNKEQAIKLRFKINKRSAYITFILVGMISIFFGYKAFQLKFSYDIETFLSKSNPSYQFYQNYVDRFGGENNFLLVGINHQKGVDNQLFLKKIEALSLSLEKNDFVEKVISPTNINKKVVTPLGLTITVPFIHLEDEDRLKKDILKLKKEDQFTRSFISNDLKSISLLIDKKGNATEEDDERFLTQLKGMLKDLEFEEYHVGGRVNTQHFYLTNMKQEMFYFAILGIILLLLFLYFTFRNLWGIVIPIFVLIISLVWTLGLMELTGESMSLMMVMMPTMLFVIGVSDSVHIINKFRTEFKIHQDRKLAIRITITEIGVAIFLTSFTTAIGFLTLCFMDVEPLIKFGLYTAIGIMFTYLVSILIIPSLLLVLKINFPEEQKSKTHFLSYIEQFYCTITNCKKSFVIGIILVILFSLNGLRFFKVNNNFLDDLDDSTSLKQEMLFFEDNFSGIVPFEIAIETTADKEIFDLTTLKEIERIEEFLIKKYNAGLVLSPSTIVKSVNMSLNGGATSSFKLPKTDKKNNQLLKQLDKWKLLDKYKSIVTEDKKYGRLTAKIKDMGSIRLGELNQQLMTFIENEGFHSKYTITGAAYLLNQSNRNIAKGVVKGISLALIMMLITIAVLFNSIKTAMVSLLPNLLPLLILGGLMGYIGIDLKVSTSLMFTIVLGIAVDATIHILAKYRHESLRGVAPGSALVKSFLSTGWSVMITSLIISSGFVIFLISNFESIFYTGLLVSLSLITALLSNIIILPLLLGKATDIKIRKKNR